MYNVRNIMITAWATARNAAAQFGGRSSEFMPESLRQAWAAAKAPKKQFVPHCVAWAARKASDNEGYFRCSLRGQFGEKLADVVGFGSKQYTVDGDLFEVSVDVYRRGGVVEVFLVQAA